MLLAIADKTVKDALRALGPIPLRAVTAIHDRLVRRINKRIEERQL